MLKFKFIIFTFVSMVSFDVCSVRRKAVLPPWPPVDPSFLSDLSERGPLNLRPGWYSPIILPSERFPEVACLPVELDDDSSSCSCSNTSEDGDTSSCSCSNVLVGCAQEPESAHLTVLSESFHSIEVARSSTRGSGSSAGLRGVSARVSALEEAVRVSDEELEGLRGAVSGLMGWFVEMRDGPVPPATVVTNELELRAALEDNETNIQFKPQFLDAAACDSE